MGLMHSALAMDGEISDNSNHGKGEKKEERVDRTSYFFKTIELAVPGAFRSQRPPQVTSLVFASRGFSHNSRRKSTNQAEEAGSAENGGRRHGNPQGAQLPLRVLSFWAVDFRVRCRG
jgi:hypothetical protein